MGDSITDGVLYKLEKSKKTFPFDKSPIFFLDKGDFVDLDEIIAIIETEKVKVDIRSGEAGVLSNLFAKEGDVVAVGKPLYEIDDAVKKPQEAKPEPVAQTQTPHKPAEKAAPPPPPIAKPKPVAKPTSSQAMDNKSK